MSLTHLFATANLKVLAQVGQWIRTGETSKFDFGPVSNIKAYNQPIPPKYDARKITHNKIILARSQGDDILSVKEDQIRLIETISGQWERASPLPRFNQLAHLIHNQLN